MKRMKKVISLLAAFCMVLSLSLTAFASADASPAVAKSREGVLQINLVYEDQSGNSYVLQTGSGFLIGAATGATTVITNYHVVSLSDEDKEHWSNEFGVDFFNTNNITLKIKIVVKRDVVIDASYINGSEKTDFAILELSQAIYDRAPLKVADSDEVVETQNVYALGFPWATSVVQDDQVYTSDDVTITNGIVGKFQSVDDIKFILHNVNLGHGNSGGPLVNSNGDVVGVNTMFTDADDASHYYYSIAINEVAEVLDALGITYEKAGSAAEETEAAEEEPEETTTEPAVPENTETEQTEPVTPVVEDPVVPADSQDVVEEPEGGMNMAMIGGIAAAAVVVIVIIIVVIVVSSKSKSKKKAGAIPPAGMGMGNVPPVNPQTPPHAPQTPPVFTPGTMPVDTGAGETSVLGGGAGETSVLGGGNVQPAATLTRRKNGETVKITKPLFIIGKERQKVDFCVPDNNSVSRNHANIICKGGVYYIVDKNSTNYTFVNGNKINPNQEVKLNSGDKIKLADEEFEFHL